MTDLEEIQDRVLYGISVNQANELRAAVADGDTVEEYLATHPTLKESWDKATELVADRKRSLGK